MRLHSTLLAIQCCRLTDEALIERLQTGDRDALTTLYERYADRVFAYFQSRVRDRDLAEDLTSDVFVRVLEKHKTYRASGGCFAAWIFGIARNRLTDHWRRARPAVDLEAIAELPGDDDTSATGGRAVDMTTARRVLASLSAAQREIVLLRLWDGLSYREIADLTGTTENACKVNFCRALQKLKTSDLLVLLCLLTHLA